MDAKRLNAISSKAIEKKVNTNAVWVLLENDVMNSLVTEAESGEFSHFFPSESNEWVRISTTRDFIIGKLKDLGISTYPVLNPDTTVRGVMACWAL